MPSVVVRRTRSARTPNGSVAIAPTSDVTVTSRPMSVFVMCSAVPELGRRRADGRGIRAGESEHAREDDDDLRPLLAAEQARHATPERVPREKGNRERVFGDAFAPAFPAHAGNHRSWSSTRRGGAGGRPRSRSQRRSSRKGRRPPASGDSSVGAVVEREHLRSRVRAAGTSESSPASSRGRRE